VKDGPFYTSTGLTAGIDLSLALIEEDFGRHVAHSAALELVTPLHRREAEPVKSVVPNSESAPSDRFGELVAWIMRHLDSDLSVETLARRACISQRHFSRAFKSVFGTSPSEFVENLRLNEARRRLSTRQKTLHSVAASVGFKNATAFHRAFEKRFGTRPSRFPGASARFDEPAPKLSVVGD
jgi:transcriptional regulator GlxA family with amidase domain